MCHSCEAISTTLRLKRKARFAQWWVLILKIIIFLEKFAFENERFRRFESYSWSELTILQL